MICSVFELTYFPANPFIWRVHSTCRLWPSLVRNTSFKFSGHRNESFPFDTFFPNTCVSYETTCSHVFVLLCNHSRKLGSTCVFAKWFYHWAMLRLWVPYIQSFSYVITTYKFKSFPPQWKHEFQFNGLAHEMQIRYTDKYM